MSTWQDIQDDGGTSTSLTERPQAQSMLYDNTTVTGSWILLNTSNITAAYKSNNNRVINNVTLAMPHAGVMAAAQDPKNGILQPDDLAGVGQYSLRASVVSPAMNVLCINANASELGPIVYATWPNAITNDTAIPNQKKPWVNWESDLQVKPGSNYPNTTVLDDLFQWGEKHGRQPPIFTMVCP